MLDISFWLNLIGVLLLALIALAVIVVIVALLVSAAKELRAMWNAPSKPAPVRSEPVNPRRYWHGKN